MDDAVKGNQCVFSTLGSSSHSERGRHPDDYYATDPVAVDLLCDVETFDGGIWEPCCGQGHISETLKRRGYSVHSTDLYDRGYGIAGVDFFAQDKCPYPNIITNPPYKMGTKFLEHALSILPEGGKMALFLKVLFLEGKNRKRIFEAEPFQTLYVSASRLNCAKGGDFENIEFQSAIAYGWYVWIKGYRGDSAVKWIN